MSTSRAGSRVALCWGIYIWICTLSSYPDSKLSDLHPKGQGGIYIWICTLYMLYIYICYRVFNMANGL